jgi:hypothetical protein
MAHFEVADDISADFRVPMMNESLIFDNDEFLDEFVRRAQSHSPPLPLREHNDKLTERVDDHERRLTALEAESTSSGATTSATTAASTARIAPVSPSRAPRRCSDAPSPPRSSTFATRCIGRCSRSAPDLLLPLLQTTLRPTTPTTAIA